MSNRVVDRRNKKSGHIVYAVVIAACICAVAFGIIKGSAVATNAQSTKTAEKYYKSVLVDKGDNLWSIAEENMTSGYDDKRAYIAEVKSINHLNSDTIHSGEYICVPYYK